ncbi:HTH-type transcriptional repressor YtrA [compost metagenome]
MNDDLLLKIDTHLTFNVNTQIKEQLKWLIGINQIQPGDMLPPANQLADLLGLNRNTVNWVYNQLRDEGIVTMQKGRGTQVNANQQTEELQKTRPPMHQLLTKTIEEAQIQGFALHEFFTASLAYILLHNHKQADQDHVLFIECKGHDHIFYYNEIHKVTGAAVKTIFLEDLIASESLRIDSLAYSNLIITTLNHADEVKQLFAPYETNIHVIGATVVMPLLFEIAQLQPGSQVSFVCLGKAGGQWMASRVHDAGIAQIKPTAIGIEDRELLIQSIQQADKIYASAAVYSELQSLAPDKVELFPMMLEKSSENLLQELSKSSI